MIIHAQTLSGKVHAIQAGSIYDFNSADLPPIPRPESPSSILPGKSSATLISSVPYTDFYFGIYLQDTLLYYLPSSEAPKKHPFPKNLTISYSIYWLNLASYILKGPQTFSHSVAHSEGMSRTASETLSGTLGVSVKGLSIKLSETFSRSITITDETTVTDEYGVTVPDGQTMVYTLWQLVDSFQILDENGQFPRWEAKVDIGGIYGTGSFKPNEIPDPTTTVAADPVSFTDSL